MASDLERKFQTIDQSLGYYMGRIASFPMIAPEHVYFNLTDRCNLRCRMCGISKNSGAIDTELSTAEIKDIVLQVKELGTKHVIFSGGEPLLKKDIVEILEYAVSLDIGHVSVVSNGTLLDPEILRQMIAMRLDHLTVSLDGLKEANDAVRGEGVFDRVAASIDQLNDYKLRYASSLPSLGINFTIMDNNIDDMLPMIEFAKRKKANVVFFQPVLFDNTHMEEGERSPLWPSEASSDKLKKVLRQVIEFKEACQPPYITSEKEILEGLLGYFRDEKTVPDFKCYDTIKRIVILYDGKVWSCAGIYGDLKKRPLRKIWLSRRAREIREKAKGCTRHCLQDCVCLSSNIFEQTEDFMKRLDAHPGEAESLIKKRLLKRMDYYMRNLRARLGGRGRPAKPS